jgi:hypothetical protein
MDDIRASATASNTQLEFMGWSIQTNSPARGGPFGRNTVIASAQKGEQVISATAWSAETALAMVKDMISLREG